MTAIEELDVIVDLGLQPVSNRFLLPGVGERAPNFPIKLVLNNVTGVLSLQEPFPVTELRPRYDWLRCFEPENHLDSVVQKISDLPGITTNSVFSGYSFKDDSTLERLRAKGYANVWRIDPKKDLGVDDRCASVETFQSVFGIDKAKEIISRNGLADVIIVRHVIEHAYDIKEFVSGIRMLVRKGGYIVWELPDCEKAFNEGDCTTIWEEHTHYFTSYSFKRFLTEQDFSILHFECIPYSLENCLFAITQSDENKEGKHLFSTDDQINREIERAYRFADNISARKRVVESKLEIFQNTIGPIAIFGAGHLSVAFISIMEVTQRIKFVIDDDPNKAGLLMPIGNIRIVGADCLYTEEVRLCLLGLNPENHATIMEKHHRFLDKGGIFASIFPGTEFSLENMI